MKWFKPKILLSLWITGHCYIKVNPYSCFQLTDILIRKNIFRIYESEFNAFTFILLSLVINKAMVIFHLSFAPVWGIIIFVKFHLVLVNKSIQRSSSYSGIAFIFRYYLNFNLYRKPCLLNHSQIITVSEKKHKYSPPKIVTLIRCVSPEI